MKRCPTCCARCFDDMEVCFGCLHRFEEGPACEGPSEAPVPLPDTTPGPAAPPAGGAAVPPAGGPAAAPPADRAAQKRQAKTAAVSAEDGEARELCVAALPLPQSLAPPQPEEGAPHPGATAPMAKGLPDLSSYELVISVRPCTQKEAAPVLGTHTPLRFSFGCSPSATEDAPRPATEVF